ncbi:MAG: double-strand break repair protein AddB [Pseudomonadota bacterium]
MGSVFNIPAEQPFALALATGLLRRFGPAELARVRLLLPSRRACLGLQDAFLDAGDGAPLLLPRLTPVAESADDEPWLDGFDAGHLPPALGDLRRQLLLTDLVRAQDPDLPDEQAFRLAAELGTLIDELTVEGVPLAALADLSFDEVPEHFSQIGRFLGLLAGSWPNVLAEEGRLDAVERRRRLLAATAARWTERAPGPVVLAGITGSVPAVGALAAVVAAMPEGIVVLPGLDPELGDAEFEALVQVHPQWGFSRLLRQLGLAPSAVAPWPYDVARTAPDRRRLFARMANPAGWAAPVGLDVGRALAGVRSLEAPHLADEALAIALELRLLLEDPDARAIVVTPDRNLARRIAAELGRFGVALEDSAGQPLDQSAPGNFVLLAAHAFLDPDPVVALLALLKHPLARLGGPVAACRRLARALELQLRAAGGSGFGWQAIDRAATALGDADTESMARLHAFAAPLRSLAACDAVPLGDLVGAHLGLVQALAADGEADDAELWAGTAGDELTRFLQDLQGALQGLRPLAPSAYPPILATAMASRSVRRPFRYHPQIELLGRFESRLADADLVILAGLNEGVWPPIADAGPWLGRRQRREVGLPPAEQHLGFAAHDFVQLAASAPGLILSRSRRDAGGAPTLPSRWLSQLDRALAAADGTSRLLPSHAGAWARSFDVPPGRPAPRPRPGPRPPVAARPSQLSVSAVERLIHNPYAVYAERVLGLRPLEPLVRPPDASERGMLVHRALERFTQGDVPRAVEDADAMMLAIGDEVLDPRVLGEAVVALWGPRFRRTAAWFVRQDGECRASGRPVAAEQEVVRRVQVEGRELRLVGRIDRLEHATDALAIVDYKTGSAPPDRDVVQGWRPQLPLLGALVASGDSPPVAALAHWELKGGDPAGRVAALSDVGQLIETTFAGVLALLRAYENPAVPYLPVPRPQTSRFPDPFAPLSRDQEWLDAEALD